MHRHPQWEQRLAEFVEKQKDKPYTWGENDCLLFAANAARAITGTDYARGHRGKYKSFASAYSYLKKLGFESARDMLDATLERKPVGFAQRGDIVMAEDGIPALCMGAFALSVCEGEANLVRVPREEWVDAWAVGEQHADFPRPRKRRK